MEENRILKANQKHR